MQRPMKPFDERSPAPRGLLPLLAALLAVALAAFFLPACSGRTVSDAVTIATSPNAATVGRVLGRRAVNYAANPAQLERDVKSMQAALQKLFGGLRGKAEDKWGTKDAEVPSPKRYVKYLSGYKTRTIVDFEAGTVTVETVDTEKPLEALREAIVVTLLTPRDPRAVDLFSDKEIRLGDEPYLLGLVLDHENQEIRWEWRAERYADWLLAGHLAERQGPRPEKDSLVRYVRIDMAPGRLERQAAKYLPEAKRHAAAYGLDTGLVLSIMRVESDFNPFAVSHAGAFGLMQVVPGSAGRDVYEFLNGKPGFPNADELLNPETNIRYGSAYLHLLETRLIAPVDDPVSREYCAVAAYNGGPGSVLRTFASDRSEALRRINGMPPDQVYDTITQKHPADETRRYLWKVVMARREFRGIEGK